MEDYIEGIDPLSDPSILVMVTNSWGEARIGLLLAGDICILNGRNTVNNIYTWKDVSMVDYTLGPYQHLRLHFDFEVKGVGDLFYGQGV